MDAKVKQIFCTEYKGAVLMVALTEDGALFQCALDIEGAPIKNWQQIKAPTPINH